MKLTVAGAVHGPGSLLPKFAVTPFNTVTYCVLANARLQPDELITRKVTVKFPEDAYICEGCCWVEVLPSPKSQNQLVIVPVPGVLLSVKFTRSGKHPVVRSAVKVVDGLGNTVM